jgi:hypothetical protein
VPTLREVQAAFAQGVLDPSLAARVASGIVGGGIAPKRRLALYRNNVLSSLRRVLEGTFPATRRLLGPERFAEIALAFIRSAPPDRPQLLAYGAGFPAFVERWARPPPCRTSPMSRGSSGRARKPSMRPMRRRCQLRTWQ